MEFRTGALNLKITSCNEVSRFFIGLVEWKVEIGDFVQDMCGEHLLPKCSYYEMQGNVLNGYETVFIF